MLHMMLLNLCLLHYLSFMCVTMMVFSACMNDTVHLCQYLKVACDRLWFIMRLSSQSAFGGYQHITKLQNRIQYFNRL